MRYPPGAGSLLMIQSAPAPLPTAGPIPTSFAALPGMGVHELAAWTLAPRLHVWAPESLQSQICSGVPIDELPPRTSRQRLAASCERIEAPVRTIHSWACEWLQLQSWTSVPDCEWPPLTSRHRSGCDARWR